MSEIMYLQINKNVEVTKREVTIGDVATIYCTDKSVTKNVESINILTIPQVRKKRVCVSVMAVIQLINSKYPQLEINNLGESDFVVDYIEEKPTNRIVQWLLIGFVAVFTLVGSMYAIMAYNNDVGTVEIFQRIYERLGYEHKGAKVLEISYAVGLAAGIILFYNHFGGKRFGTDPTPIEVEMDKYEGDIDTTLIDRSIAARKEKSL